MIDDGSNEAIWFWLGLSTDHNARQVHYIDYILHRSISLSQSNDF